MVARMVIKMIIFSFVSILVFSHIVTCFPSLEGDSRLINDTHKMLAKLGKSNIKKPKLPNEPVIKFLKKLDCNSDPNFDRNNADSSEILESCDFDNWEINEKAAKKKPSSKTAETIREISSTTHTFSTYRQGGESKPSNEPNTGVQNSGKVNDKKPSTKNGKNSAGTSGKKTAQRKHYTENPSDSINYDDNVDDDDEEEQEVEEQEEPTTGGGDVKDIDYGDNDGLFVRILLMLILVMQNAFVFVLFLFYRSMKNNAK
ncbi:uncharacterized protein LOC135843930 [Planococcus citri]|uniref:uncharacterized protein LOC135843930 n=1 Tax=Planococcus citri TaxID=170843 RepID=UPI0031F76AFF